MRTSSWPFFLRSALVAFAVAILSVLLIRTPVHAESDYGNGAYGQCFYGTGSDVCKTNTTTQTPSGLKVAINLVDNQVVPRTGYTVIMTPLNGSGSSFKSATIYIDGKLVTTVTPGSNGTATWFWDTLLYPGTLIRFVITDQSGNDTPQSFNVRIAEEGEPTPVPGQTTDGTTPPSEQRPGAQQQSSFQKQIGVFFTQVGDTTADFFRSLPREVINSFPWIIFILLSLQILILFAHSRRELKTFKDIEAAAERVRHISALKSDFMNLLAHHLRTPFTTLQGGLELQSSESGSESTASLQAAADEIHTTIDTILEEASEETEISPLVTAHVHSSLRTYLPILSLLILAGVVAFGFIYLANTVTSLESSAIDIIVKILVYLLLCSFAVLFFRQLRLRQSQRDIAQAVLVHEKTLENARNHAIELVNERLSQHINTLNTLLPTLPEKGMGLEFIKPALSDLTKLSSKFIIANQLTDAKDELAAKPYSLTSLYEPIAQQIQAKADEKHISLTIHDRGIVVTSKPQLVSVVLQNLLENAIAYSPENSAIAASVTNDGKQSKLIVMDTGDGMTKEQLSELFQPFYKAEGSETYNHPGMGFSLYLDKLITAYLGGTIQAESEPHVTTNFTVTLPQRATT